MRRPAISSLVRMESDAAKRRDAVLNRQAVIDAATGLLPADPDAGMQEIADAAGLGRSTVYRHFSSREELFDAVAADVIGRGIAAVEEILATADGVEETLCSIGELGIGFGLRYRFLYSHREEARAAVMQLTGDRGAPLWDFLNAAQGRGEIRGDQPVAWIATAQFEVMTVMIGDVLAGRVDRDDASAILGDTLVAMAVPR
jgi:AcrR family transcriptional regulator